MLIRGKCYMRMEDFSNAITDFETALGVSDLIDCPNIETPVIYLIMLNKTYENYYDCLKKLFKELFKMEDLSGSELLKFLPDLKRDEGAKKKIESMRAAITKKVRAMIRLLAQRFVITIESTTLIHQVSIQSALSTYC